MIFLTHFSYGQKVIGLELSEINSKYIDLAGKITGLNTFKIQIDYGQSKSIFSKELYLRDDLGHQVEYLSVLIVLNIMNEYGYELVCAYTKTGNGDPNEINYIMQKRKIENKE